MADRSAYKPAPTIRESRKTVTQFQNGTIGKCNVQIHEAVSRLLAGGEPQEMADKMVVYALQARRRGGWAAFTPDPAAGMSKETAERAFDRAGISPDEIKFPAWYQPPTP